MTQVLRDYWENGERILKLDSGEFVVVKTSGPWGSHGPVCAFGIQDSPCGPDDYAALVHRLYEAADAGWALIDVVEELAPGRSLSREGGLCCRGLLGAMGKRGTQ